MKAFIILILTCSISTLYAQKTICKPKTKANKNKALVFEDVKFSHAVWQHGDMDVIYIHDSVKVTKGNIRITAYKVENGLLAGPKYMEYRADGTIKQIDSLSTDDKWRLKGYLGSFCGRAVYHRAYDTNGIINRTIYYKQNGKDSIRQDWYPNGLLYQTVRTDITGADSSTHIWNKEGLLQSIKTPGSLKKYSPSGYLQTNTIDTIVVGGDGFGFLSRRMVECRKTYYPTGILSSLMFYCEGMPCHTWFDYAENGQLAKTETKESIFSIPYSQMVERIEPIDYLPISDEMEPKIPGGKEHLAQYLNEKLAEVSCKSTLPLSGIYKIEFTVTTDGKSIFENMTGTNHAAIQEAVKLTVQKLPWWIPGKMDGKYITTSFILTLSLKKIK